VAAPHLAKYTKCHRRCHLRRRQRTMAHAQELMSAASGVDSIRTHMPKNSESRRVLVVLLGWTECRERHLQKYADAYREVVAGARAELAGEPLLFREHSGFWTMIFSDRQRIARTVAASIEAEKSARGATHLVIHGFSNGAGFLLSALAALRTKALADVLVMDCLPGDTEDFTMLFNFLRTIFGRPLACAMIPFCLLLRPLSWLWQRVLRRRGWQSEYRDSLVRFAKERVKPHSEGGHVVQLYSEADDLIQWQEIERTRAALEGAGIRVQWKKWNTGRHVALLMDQAEEYRVELRKIVEGRGD